MATSGSSTGGSSGDSGGAQDFVATESWDEVMRSHYDEWNESGTSVRTTYKWLGFAAHDHHLAHYRHVKKHISFSLAFNKELKVGRTLAQALSSALTPY